MTSFKFPPPPPPPPRASSNDNQPSYPSQRGGAGRGRSDGNRGRGGQSRGGNNNFGGNTRGGQGQAHGGGGNSHSRGGPRGGYQNNRGGDTRRGGSGPNHGIQQQYAPPAHVPSIPTGPYVNPPFASPTYHGGNAQSPVDPNALVQAMAFMATPAGVQSMAAFASHMAYTGNPPYVPTPPPQQAHQSAQFSPTQQSGQKRKWDDRRNNGNAQSQPQPPRKPQQQGSKPPRAKAAVPPPVPTFGFSLPKPPPAPPFATSKPNKAIDSRKRKVKLGLAYAASSDESSEDESVDEEVVLGSRLKGGGYAFEHEGEHISLQTAGDIVAWIKDRKRNFPTLQKAREKAEAAMMKRRNELEFVRKLKGKPPRAEIPPRQKPVPKVREPNERDEKKQEELAALRKRLHESLHRKSEAPATIDLGLGYGSETDSGDGSSSVLSESSVVSSSEESEDDSDDSDAPPEPTSSKVAPPPIKVPPPPVGSQTQRKPDKEKICQNFKQYGKCPFGQSCKFKHPKKESKSTGLYEKLVEQELVKSDQVALDAIKFLGQNGFLG
ncbi:hypothetical protein CC86DRAFT_443318 [Ophiobolus disseminans]|uniref:C3H1-type domain-containing protein n=1 Tax=Ophiobolus disseminans TaxID=1469910 RepID=A0A6A7AGH1_9PLEO|nr:hypothetical protein CC86DRAFT_443318 [Ophiobolus disseminans]